MTDATPTRAQRFRDIVVPAAERAGYTGHGAKARFARDTGMTESSVTRMWQGMAVPDDRFYDAISQVIGMDHPIPESSEAPISSGVSVSRAASTSSVPFRNMLSISVRLVTATSSAFLCASHSSKLSTDGSFRASIIRANLPA